MNPRSCVAALARSVLACAFTSAGCANSDAAPVGETQTSSATGYEAASTSLAASTAQAGATSTFAASDGSGISSGALGTTSAVGGANGSGVSSTAGTGGGGSGGATSTTDPAASSTGGASSLTSSGGAVSGGPGASGGNGSAGAGGFELDWFDEFDTLDESRWTAMTHTWDGNLAQFAAETVAVESGILRLSLVAAPQGSEKPYLGVEYRSIDAVQFGKVEARIRFAKGSAVVSSLVLLYTPWPPDDWNELDIECLGNTADEVQFNHMVNVPPADPATGHLQFPELTSLGFDPTEDFHDYAIEWVPGRARFLVDGSPVYEATEEMERMVLPQNVLLTIWASDAADWAGPVDGTTAPTYAEYDWIRVYRYTGSDG